MNSVSSNSDVVDNVDASDEELLVRYRERGDSSAFESLVRRHERPMYNYLIRYTRNASLSEEVFQATFLRLHEKCHLFSPGGNFRPWLYSIATHQAIDALRREGRHRAARLDDDFSGGDVGGLLDLLQSPGQSPWEEAEEHERAEWARRAVDALPEHQRVAVLLIYFQGLKYREAAEALHVPEGTVKSRIHKALMALNKAWRDDHRGE